MVWWLPSPCLESSRNSCLVFLAYLLARLMSYFPFIAPFIVPFGTTNKSDVGESIGSWKKYSTIDRPLADHPMRQYRGRAGRRPGANRQRGLNGYLRKRLKARRYLRPISTNLDTIGPIRGVLISRKESSYTWAVWVCCACLI